MRSGVPDNSASTNDHNTSTNIRLLNASTNNPSSSSPGLDPEANVNLNILSPNHSVSNSSASLLRHSATHPPTISSPFASHQPLTTAHSSSLRLDRLPSDNSSPSAGRPSVRPPRRARSPTPDPSVPSPRPPSDSLLISSTASENTTIPRAAKRQRRRCSLTMDDSISDCQSSSAPQAIEGLPGSHAVFQLPLGISNSRAHADQLPAPPVSGSNNSKLDCLLKSFRDGLHALDLNNQPNSHLDGPHIPSSGLSYPPRATHPPWPQVSDIGREELVRLLLQSLKEIGYPAAAMTLEAESGFSLDPNPEITAFRDNILSGNWYEVEALLKREHSKSLEQTAEGSYLKDSRPVTTPLREIPQPPPWLAKSLLGVDSEVLNMARFLVAQQKYLELLESGEYKKALMVLRRELAPLASPTQPLNSDMLLKMNPPASTIDSSLNKLSVGIKNNGSELPMTSWLEDANEDPGVQRLCLLSSLMMCGTVDEIRERAMWGGIGRGSRIKLLEDLQALIPPEKLLPHHRLSHLLEQSKTLQRLQCIYHVTNPQISLLSNHTCSRFSFPIQTSHVLSQHSDEVWRIEWSHDGTRLASAGRDTKCIIWKLSPVKPSSKFPGSASFSSRKSSDKPRGQLNLSDSPSPSTTRDMLWRALSTPATSDANLPTPYLAGVPPPPYDESFCAGNGEVTIAVHLVLDGHPAGISCIAWSPDDSVLLTGSDCTIKMWNTRTGDCIATMVKHEYDVSALSWLPDGHGFVSGGMDSDVLFWDLKGQNTFTWRVSPSRVLDLAVSPDGKRLVAIGLASVNATSSHTESSHDHRTSEASNGTDGSKNKQRRIHIFNIAQKREEAMIPQLRELTCVSISDDSKYALINQSPNEVHLYSLEAHCLIRRYVGQKQGEFIIRSCFGGMDRNFILSGSEDSKVYVWHKETGSLIEVLDGHGEGSVNAVAWNPKHPSMFASASDDHTVRIWQAPGPHRSTSAVLEKD